MAQNQTSTEFTHVRRDVQTQFEQLVASSPTLLSLIRRGANAAAHKVEWPEWHLTPLSTTISSFDTTGTGTGINVASTAGITPGMILRFESSGGIDRAELVKVASVDSATDLTVVRRYGDTPASAVPLSTGDVVRVVSKPIAEGGTASAGANKQGAMAYNFTQIFERTAALSRTALKTSTYDEATLMSTQVDIKMQEVMMEVNQAVIWGERVQRVDGGENGSMGGILAFLRGGNVDTTGGNLSATIINNLLESVYADGASSNEYVLLCNPSQAKRLSAFNTAGSNPIVSIPQGTTTTGGYISTFVGNLPVMDGAFTARVVVEPSFPKDKVGLLDMSRIELAYLDPFAVKDVTSPNYDGKQEQVLGELTVRIRDGQKAHAIATGLNV